MFKSIKSARNKTANISIIFAIVGTLGSYAALRDGKYPTVDFCFLPETAMFKQNFCINGKQIYRTSPKFLLSKQQVDPNPEFINGDEKFYISSKGRVIKNFNKQSNPFYFYYSLISCGLTSIGYFLYSQTYKKYSEDFPRIFEKYKTDVLALQLEGEQSREVGRFKTVIESDYVKKGIVKEFQMMEMLEMDSESIQDYQRSIRDKEQKETLIQDKTFNLQVSEIDTEISRNKLAELKIQKEIEKLEKKDKVQESKEDLKKLEMIEKLKEHENGWIFKIVEFRKPLWIIGGMGSGKSTLASSIILLRHYLLDCPLELIIDAHAQVNRLDCWEYLMNTFPGLEIVGDNNDYQAIAKAFEDSINRWAFKMPKFKKGEIGKSQILVDEFSNYADKEECSDAAASFSKQSLSDPRKAGEYVIMISHFDTQTGTGNKGGTSKARKTQTICIERKSANGETPLENVTINGLPDESGNMEEFNGTVPDWMKPEKIIEFFSN